MKTAHEQTLRQRIEALRDDLESISLDNHIYADGEGVKASIVVAWLTAALAVFPAPFPKMAVRLTHAEQARDMIRSGCNPMGPRVISHLDTAAEIERVAREVCAEWDNINNPDELELGRAMDRLRALVQP